jgi:nucleoside-diphosphate-sugar epimerase
MIDSISILGCGWMGQPTGAALAANGVRVHGSTTTPAKLDALRGDGIEPFLIELTPEIAGEDVDRFFDTDALFLNVPPPVRDVPPEDLPAYHRRQIESVIEAVRRRPIDWIVFASSTGVYPNVGGTVTEDDQPPGRPDALAGPRRSTGAVLLDVEALLANEASIDTTILRFAGLYGGDRHPGRYLAGRTGVGRPEAPVNLVHRDDCVEVVRAVLQQNVRDEVLNVCADAHPSRRELYTRAAETMDLEPPTFEEGDDRPGKIVSPDKLRRVLDYTFAHPDPVADLDAGR